MMTFDQHQLPPAEVKVERSLSELLALHSELQDEFNKAKTPENRTAALKDVRNLVKFFAITSEELEGYITKVRKPRSTGTKEPSPRGCAPPL